MIIYKITNKKNNQSYIGQTTKSFNERFEHHLKPYSKSYISKALRKYGKENFSVEILYTANSIEELNKLEIESIEKYNTLMPNGYNVLKGGRAASIDRSKIKGRPLSEEHKKKIGEANKGKIRSEEAKRKNSKWHKGKVVSKETREKIRQSNFKKDYIGRLVKDLKTGIIYKSMAEASRNVKDSIHIISRHCRGLSKQPRYQYVE